MHTPHNRAAEEDPPAPTIPPPQPTLLLPVDATNGVHPSILALFNHMQATLTTSFNNIFTRLNNQDKTITELSKPKDPCHRGKAPWPEPAAKSQGSFPDILPTNLPTPSPPLAAPAEPIKSTNVTTQKANLVPLRQLGPPPVPHNTCPQTLMPPHPPPSLWNKIATQGTFHTNTNIAQFAKAAAATQGRTTSDKHIPSKSGVMSQ